LCTHTKRKESRLVSGTSFSSLAENRVPYIDLADPKEEKYASAALGVENATLGEVLGVEINISAAVSGVML
jgi:hypothetical protein